MGTSQLLLALDICIILDILANKNTTMKILNLPLIVHEDLPNLDLARAIVRVDTPLENEIYEIAAMDRSHDQSGALRQAGDEVAFVGWFGTSPPRPVTEVSMLVTVDTVQWMGVYEDLTLGGNLKITLETEPLKLDELRATQDEEDAPKIDVVFVSVWREGKLKSPAKLNPANGVIHLVANIEVPDDYEIRVEEVVELSSGIRLPVAKLPSGANEYFVFPADIEENKDLFALPGASK